MKTLGMTLCPATLMVIFATLLVWPKPCSSATVGQAVTPTQQTAPAQQFSPTDPRSLPNIVYDLVPTRQTITRLPARTAGIIPVNPEAMKADLSCTITAYHDEARTRQVQNHLWHLNPYSYNPFLPTPWFIRWDVTVTNHGNKPTENFNTIIRFQSNAFNEQATLAAGESMVLKYQTGPFGPSYNLVGKQSTLQIFVDTASSTAETNEANNQCADFVQFVYP